MSYPAPKYHGDGEVTATLRRADHPAEIQRPSGLQVSYLATGATTQGEFGLYRWDFSEARTGPDPHYHRTISESFFILSGTVTLYDGTAWREANAGDFLFVPEGGIHGFRNESGEKASMLILFAPGAPREEYFERVAQITDDERTEFMLRHDTYWIP